MDALRPPKAKPMIAIIGLGGMGKTALAREATELCRHERLCDYVVWTSAQTERFIGEGIIKTEISDYSFDTLLSDIGRQCGRMEIVQASVEHKTGAVKHLLADKHVLIVLDNLETVLERDNLVDNVFRILGKSKLLITSRYRVKHEQVYTIPLGGFTEDESAEFLCMEGEERNIEVITQASRSELIEIHQVTGGAPLAMKLVVGQMSEQPMYKVMESFRKVSFQSQDYEFYRFLFKRSWDMLSSDAKKVLIAMSCFALTIGGTWEAVRDISGMKEAEPALHSAMRQLVLMSLIDPVGDINQRRYVIHPLTNYFILSDIVKEWG
jgi:hypothetical protein